MSEKVLCVERSDFESLLRSFHAPVPGNTTVYVHGITPHQWSGLSVPFGFVGRDECETDDGLKQMIPYVVIRHAGKYLAYSRTGQSGEKRLVGRKSIGIGGHINQSDLEDGGTQTLSAILRSCAAREVKEELGADVPAGAFQFRGILYSALDDVSRKHFGIVMLADLNPGEISRPEETLARLEWKTPFELHRERRDYETWSGFLAMHLMRHKDL